MSGRGADSSAVTVAAVGLLEPKRLGAEPAQCQEDHVYHMEGTGQILSYSTGVPERDLIIPTKIK